MPTFPFSRRLKTRTEDGETIPARNPWHYIERHFEPLEGVDPPLWIVVFADNADFGQEPPEDQPRRAFRIEDGELIARTDGTEPTNDEYFVFKRGTPHSTLKFVVEHSGMSNDILFGDEILINNTDDLEAGETFELPGVEQNLEAIGTTPPGSPDETPATVTRTDTAVTPPADGTGPATTVAPTEPQTPVAPSRYDLREGETEPVVFDGETYKIVSQIPGVSADRFAVTTESFDLVPPTLARDVLTLHTWKDSTWTVDWEAAEERTRRLRRDAERLKLMGRAVDVGWDLTEILVFFVAGVPTAAIGPIVDLGTDAIEWTVSDVERPYREVFQKLVTCADNGRSVDRLAGEIRRRDEMGDALGRRVGATVGLASEVSDLAQLGQAWDEMYTALDDTGAYTSSVNTALGATKGLFIGYAVSSTVGLIEDVVKTKTTLHAITYDYATVRLPIVRTLQALDDRLADGVGTIGDVLAYDTYLRTNYQMNALLFETASRYWQAISDSPTGGVWDVLADAQSNANRYAQTADTMRQMLRYEDLTYGHSWIDTDQKTRQSVNTAVFGGVES
ncbi:hypothetical protein [Halobaculum sp. MBLA0143]|uniref:hypothetical protein n=1 Tax=Halobaculum sp. MBLA0143 TaxID=3079933 RepID=UPI003523B822